MPHTGYFWNYDKEAVDAVNAAGLTIVPTKHIVVEEGYSSFREDSPTLSPLSSQQFGVGPLFTGILGVEQKFIIDKDGNISLVGTVDGLDISVHAAAASAHHTKTVAGELNHQELANRGVADHHAKYTDAEVFAALGLRPKLIDIGDWDCDATPSVNVAHGLTKANIRYVDVLIRSDDDGVYASIDQDTGSGARGRWYADATNITLFRTTDGGLDNDNFDATGYNRGWIVIWYVP